MDPVIDGRDQLADHETAAVARSFRHAVHHLPVRGAVRQRWNALIDLARRDLPVARLVEAHLDAASILGELGPAESGTATTATAKSDVALAGPDRYWSVWAAEPPDGRVTATLDSLGGWRLAGTKRWCSGAHICSHALVTAHTANGERLFALDLAQPGIDVGCGEWAGPGMRRADTESVDLDDVRANAVGGPSAYLDRPGFWHGAVGVAACWYGGALGVAAPLRAASKRLDPHGLAHLGAVDSALHAARCALRVAGLEIEDGATEDVRTAKIRALRTRSIVEWAAHRTMEFVGKALGPALLAHDAEHAQRVADLTVYIRQSHAERDHAILAKDLHDETGAL